MPFASPQKHKTLRGSFQAPQPAFFVTRFVETVLKSCFFFLFSYGTVGWPADEAANQSPRPQEMLTLDRRLLVIRGLRHQGVSPSFFFFLWEREIYVETYDGNSYGTWPPVYATDLHFAYIFSARGQTYVNTVQIYRIYII